MKKRIINFIAWLLGVKKELKPVIDEGTELYEKAKKQIKIANKDGKITIDEAKQIGHIMVDDGSEFAFAIIELIKKLKKK